MLVELKKCMAIEMDNIDMPGFMRTVFQGDDIKINRKVSFSPPLVYLPCISKRNMGVLAQIIDTVFKIESYTYLTF